ncbi:hypothetical protein PHET_11418 [Paragonimus heterotremus]|uniref:Uncharacterized protein n=1 Tax=Paragonimus heterotremus TaxID=100268 RepID=A0A8J4WTB4_9TREM|nr:hypothetical protein PHET_11418 [Paragonimus heterotremus]
MPSRNASLDLLKRCEYVAPGQIGLCRKSMLTRETLQRPKTGQCLTRGRPKQPIGFVYGVPNSRNPNEILQCFNWPIKEQGDQIDPKCLPRDFHRINVESIKRAIHPVPEWIRFANEKDYRLNPTKRVLGRLRKPKFPADMTFGTLARPSTSMQCIIAHRYKSLWDEHALEVNKSRMTALARSQNDTPQPLDCTSSVLNILPIGTKQQTPRTSRQTNGLWKLHRFEKQHSRLQTRWTKEETKRLLRSC